MLKRFGNTIGIFLIFSVIQIPLNIARVTYFEDKKHVVVNFIDGTEKSMYITKSSYIDTLSCNSDLQLLDGSVIPKSKIYCINLSYSPFTSDNDN